MYLSECIANAHSREIDPLYESVVEFMMDFEVVWHGPYVIKGEAIYLTNSLLQKHRSLIILIRK